jgi:PhnB protein
MTFYQTCFGGELILQRVSESPMALQMPSEAGDQILHSQLIQGDVVLMGSDRLGAHTVAGNTVTLCFNCNSLEEVSSYFNKLSQGGNVKTHLHQTFWGATYGELTDKFGMQWIFNYTKI